MYLSYKRWGKLNINWIIYLQAKDMTVDLFKVHESKVLDHLPISAIIEI